MKATKEFVFTDLETIHKFCEKINKKDGYGVSIKKDSNCNSITIEYEAVMPTHVEVHEIGYCDNCCTPVVSDCIMDAAGGIVEVQNFYCHC